MSGPRQSKTLARRGAILILSSLLGCGGPPTIQLGPEAPLRQRPCSTTLRYVAEQPVSSVILAGSWNGFAEDTTVLRDEDQDGTWTVTTTLQPGLYAYKLIVDGEWILDPANDYRAYDGGFENSGLRVPDCAVPLLDLADDGDARVRHDTGAATFRLRYWAGADGSAPTELGLSLRGPDGDRPLSESEARWDVESWRIEVTLRDLPLGKYTLRASPVDAAGIGVEPLLLPFWIEEEAFDWRDALTYMILTDRYRDGDPSNNPAPVATASPSADWQGGDLAGVRASIEDGTLDELGVRALWLTPWNTNATGPYEATDPGHIVTSYHGYWPVQPREVDPRLGGPDALRAMVDAAHRHGIRVLMDLVVNHVHEDHPYLAEHPDWFRTVETGCVCGSAGCGWTERRLDCLFTPYLPDVNWERNDTAEAFLADALWWLGEFDLDGFRVDAVKHVPDSAIFNLSIRVHEAFEQAGTEYFLMGETAMGWGDCDPADPSCNAENYGTISRYIGPTGLNGQFDFVLFHSSALPVFAQDTYSMTHADVWTNASQERYPAGAVMTPYIGSHDTSRFLSNVSHPWLTGNKWEDQELPPQPSEQEPYQRLALAQAWNLTIPGAPLLYYGDEYGEYGGSDPDNRHFWRPPSERSAYESALAEVTAAIGTARAALPALRRGDFRTARRTEDFWAYARTMEDGDFALVALNRSDQPITEVIYLESAYAPLPGTLLMDWVGDADVLVDSSGVLELTLPPWGIAILAP